MGNTTKLTILYFVAIFLLLVFNELIYRRFHLKGEVTRKIAHFLATLAVIPFPYLFETHWQVLALALIFFAVLYFTKRSTHLNSIHDIDRESVGSYMLPLAIYLTFLLSCLTGNKLMFILPMLILAICDPMATILGMNNTTHNHRIQLFGIKTKKTVLGSGAFLVSAFIISLIALNFNQPVFGLEVLWLALAIALVGTLAELMSWRGTDNISIPLSVALMLWIFL